MEIRLAFESDFKRWEQFLSSQDVNNIFQSTILLPVNRILGFTPILILAEDHNEIMGGLMSYQWFGNTRNPLKIFSRIQSKYGPIIRDCGNRMDILDAILKFLIEAAKKNGVRDLILKCPPGLDFNGWDNMLQKNRSDVHYTFLIDLKRSKSQLWRSLEKRCRWAVRKALSQKVEIREENTKETPIVYYSLLVSTAKRLGIFTEPCTYFETVYNLLVPRGYAKYFFAYYRGKPIASALVFFYNKTMFYFSSCSLKRYRSLNPNNLLQWYIITFGADNGFESYDLMGCPGPREKEHEEYGLYIFKRSFGGTLTRATTYALVFSLLRKYIWESLMSPVGSKLWPVIGSRFFKG